MTLQSPLRTCISSDSLQQHADRGRADVWQWSHAAVCIPPGIGHELWGRSASLDDERTYSFFSKRTQVPPYSPCQAMTLSECC